MLRRCEATRSQGLGAARSLRLVMARLRHPGEQKALAGLDSRGLGQRCDGVFLGPPRTSPAAAGTGSAARINSGSASSRRCEWRATEGASLTRT